jgi:ketosteroid isomerase-like protein
VLQADDAASDPKYHGVPETEGRQMSAQRNKEIAAELFARFTRSDIPGVLALMTDDVVWRIPGKPELSPAAGDYGKERIGRLFNRMLSQLEAGLKMKVLGSIAEGDSVAVEVESSGDLKNGRRYRQQYHFLLAFRDDRISAVREYLDTQHAFEVWMRP